MKLILFYNCFLFFMECIIFFCFNKFDFFNVYSTDLIDAVSLNSLLSDTKNILINNIKIKHNERITYTNNNKKWIFELKNNNICIGAYLSITYNNQIAFKHVYKITH